MFLIYALPYPHAILEDSMRGIPETVLRPIRLAGVMVISMIIGFFTLLGSNIRLKVENKHLKRLTIIEQYTLAKKHFKWLTPTLYAHVREASLKYNVPEDLIMSVIQHESRGKRYALGPRVSVILRDKRGKFFRKTYRAIGLMQVMPFNYNGHQTELFDPRTNILAGTKMLARSMRRTNDLTVILKDYNSGPNSSYYNWKYIAKVVNTYMASVISRHCAIF